MSYAPLPGGPDDEDEHVARFRVLLEYALAALAGVLTGLLLGSGVLYLLSRFGL